MPGPPRTVLALEKPNMIKGSAPLATTSAAVVVSDAASYV